MLKSLSTLRTLGLGTAAAALLVSSLGCGLYRAGKAFDEGRFEDSVKAYQNVLQGSPNNVKAKMGYRRAAARAAEAHLAKAREAEKRGQHDVVYLEVRKAAVLDPANAVAADWIANLELAAQRKKDQETAETSLEAQRAKADLEPAVALNPRSLEGMDLNYSRRTSLKDIFASLSKASGVNIVLHSSFQDTQTSVDLRGLTFQRILDTLMLQNDLLYKVMDANSIMIFKDSPQNRDKFENQLIKTFYLSNADPNDVRSIFQQLMPQLKVFTDKRLNAVTVKANPQQLTIAKRIVSQLDKAKPEVMVYLELMEVTENSLDQVGLLPVLGAGDTTGIYRIGGTIDNTGAPNQNKGGIRINRTDVRFLFPNLALDAMKSSGDAKLVASPNIRVVSGEKGDINIGEKISTTQSSIGFGGTPGSMGAGGMAGGMASSYLGGMGAQTQYSYEEVGVKITVTPRVHFNGDISMKIKSEVKTLKSGSTPGRPDLGQRIIETEARLQDGETAVFAGLLKEEEQKSLQGIWGLTDIPVVKHLLGSNRNQRAKTDVLLTIRAVIVRKPDLQFDDLVAFDPDLATSQAGPFAAKNEGKAPLKPAAKPTAPEADKPAPPKEPVAEPKAPEPEKPAQPDAKEAAKADPKPADVEEGGLVMFLAPVFTPVGKGERIELSLLVSNGKGLTSGTMEIRIDPKLKLHGVTAGDFVTAESGSLQTSGGKDGLLKLSFTRATSQSDSGTLAIIELEGVTQGNAPVLVQNGKYLVGTNPISARVVNSLVTVE